MIIEICEPDTSENSESRKNFVFIVKSQRDDVTFDMKEVDEIHWVKKEREEIDIFENRQNQDQKKGNLHHHQHQVPNMTLNLP